MAKSKDLERLYGHSVSEYKRQQIWVYCYKNPRKPQRDATRFFTKPPVIKLDKALDALERLKLYKGQQKEGNKNLITALIKAKRVI
jgi:hypothetical protein